jgi:hypothetical protein
MYEYSNTRGLGDDPDPRVVSLQQVAIENGCQLPIHGIDGSWGSETANATTCLAAQRGWPYVIENWPWVPNRPQDFVLAPQPSAPREMSNQEWLFNWGVGLFSFVAIVVMGSWLTDYAEKQRSKRR